MANWCCIDLTLQGAEEDLDKFIEENKSTEDCLTFHAADPDPNHWGTRDAVDPQLGYVSNCEVKYRFSTAWTPPLNWLTIVGVKYPTITFDMVFEEPGNQVFGHARFVEGAYSEELMEAFDYYLKYYPDFAAKLETIQKSPYQEFVKRYSDPELDGQFEETPFCYLEELIVKRIKDRDLPLFITRTWDTCDAEELYLQRTTGIGTKLDFSEEEA